MSKKPNTEAKTIQTDRSIIEFSFEYAENNPDGFLDDITQTLAHVGIFDDLANP